jgi:hypothetical protein
MALGINLRSDGGLFFVELFVFIFSQLTRLLAGDLVFGEIFGMIALLVKKK